MKLNIIVEHTLANFFAITAKQLEGNETGKSLCNLTIRGPCIVIYTYN